LILIYFHFDCLFLFLFVSGTQSRYSVQESGGVSLLRIEPVRAGRDEAPYECVAENGVGDAVSAEAILTVFEGK
jgi:receptor-type tyrosine-protein phosphatase F